MKRAYTVFALVAALILQQGCAKSVSESDNEASKRYIDAWMSLNYPEVYSAGTVGDGIWIIDDKEGTGKSAGETDFAFIEYRCLTLKNEISESSYENDARLLGSFSNGAYYGPEAANLGTSSVVACIRGAIVGGNGLEPMKVGGTRKFVSPGWLNSTTYYNTPEEYFEKVTGSSHAIYEVTLTGVTDDISQYEVDLIEKTLASNSLSAFIKELERKDWGQIDTTGNGWGFYFRSLYLPDSDDEEEEEDEDDEEEEVSWAEGEEIYINYTGRLLNGKVFDTTIRDTARFYGIESASKSYEPVLATMSKTYTSITLTSDDTSVIDGFSYLLYKMKPYEKALGVFVSDRGYQSTGSSPGIPGYAPLIFEVEITEVDSDD